MNNRSTEDNARRTERAHLLALTIAVVLLAIAVVSMAAKAQAATHEPDSLCVSRFEWRHLRAAIRSTEPATLDSVAEYLDGPGTDRGDSLHYAVCGKPWRLARVLVVADPDGSLVAVFRAEFYVGVA